LNSINTTDQLYRTMQHTTNRNYIFIGVKGNFSPFVCISFVGGLRHRSILNIISILHVTRKNWISNWKIYFSRFDCLSRIISIFPLNGKTKKTNKKIVDGEVARNCQRVDWKHGIELQENCLFHYFLICLFLPPVFLIWQDEMHKKLNWMDGVIGTCVINVCFLIEDIARNKWKTVKNGNGALWV
jgi:hypothetical protein